MKTPSSKNAMPRLDVGVSCLPGYKIPKEFTRTEFKKQHTLDYCNGYIVSKHVGEQEGLNMTDDQMTQLLDKASAALRFGDKAGNFMAKSKPQFDTAAVNATPLSVAETSPSTAATFVPTFAALDKVVLRFDAYIKETFPDGNRGQLPGASHAEQEFAIRHVMIKYFVEDDSIAVVEPPVENSGLAQGVLMKRQLLPKPAEDMVGSSIEYYTIQDFALGKDMTFYGKTFRIAGCDQFTVNYMRDVLKTPLKGTNPAEVVPQDPYIAARTRTKHHLADHHHDETNSPKHRDTLKSFLDNDRKVLRFYCSWDDRESLYGEVRDFIVHYFLVDDSIEVREVQTANNGRDPFPIMSRRQMLPKSEAFDLAQLATTTPLGTDRDVQSKKGKFYTWQDLRIGSTLNVLGRKFVINDCDSYTRSFYAERLGLGAEEMKPLGQKNAHAHDEHVAHAELAESTVKKNNFFKMLENEGKHLRFGAMLESQHKEDEGRRFVVIYRLSDDTMSIYEPKIRNSGILGGKFMERATPINPDTNKPYTAADLFVGATIAAYRHTFVLYEADEYVYKWMAARQSEFPKADVKLVLSKLRGINKAAIQSALDSSTVSVKQFVDACKPLASGSVTAHELITVARHYASGGKVDYRKFLAEL